MKLGDKIEGFAWTHPVLYYVICAAIGMAINIGSTIFVVKICKK